MLKSRPVPAWQRLGATGAVRLDAALAGSSVSVCEMTPELWEVRLVPDSEGWLHRPESLAALIGAVSWSLEHDPAETDLDELFSLASKRAPGHR